MNDQFGQDRFKKFDQHALKALNLAYQEAQHRDHHYIGTEHLLLGVMLEKDGKGAQILEELGVNADQVSRNIEHFLEAHPHTDYTTPNRVFRWFKKMVRFQRHKHHGWDAVGLTTRAKKSLELAVDEAHRLHHQQVGTEHMLFGLVSEGGGLAAQALSPLGVNLQVVRNTIEGLV
jgi:ATP-dependent Clp protease ATP-binding subunit ClpC